MLITAHLLVASVTGKYFFGITSKVSDCHRLFVQAGRNGWGHAEWLLPFLQRKTKSDTTGRPVLLRRTSILGIHPDPSILTHIKAPRRIGYDYLDVNTVKQRGGRVEFRLCLEPIHCPANDVGVILGKSLSSVPWVFYLSSNVPNSYYALWNSLTPVQERHDADSCHSFSTSVTLSSLPI